VTFHNHHHILSTARHPSVNGQVKDSRATGVLLNKLLYESRGGEEAVPGPPPGQYAARLEIRPEPIINLFREKERARDAVFSKSKVQAQGSKPWIDPDGCSEKYVKTWGNQYGPQAFQKRFPDIFGRREGRGQSNGEAFRGAQGRGKIRAALACKTELGLIHMTQ